MRLQRWICTFLAAPFLTSILAHILLIQFSFVPDCERDEFDIIETDNRKERKSAEMSWWVSGGGGGVRTPA